MPTTFASAASSGRRLPRSITAAAVTGSLMSNHNDNAATGASVTDATLTALKRRGQKRLFWGGLGRSVAGISLAMMLARSLVLASTRTRMAGLCNSLIN